MHYIRGVKRRPPRRALSLRLVKPSVLLAIAGAAAAAELMISAPGVRLAAAAATPPPTPPPINAAVTPPPAAPVPSTTPSVTFPVTGATPATASRPKPSAPPARKGIEGVWEVAIQHMNNTDYTHFSLAQQGDQLTGTYTDGKSKYPLTGTLDGQAVRLIVSLPSGTTMVLEGKLDGTTDMIGLMTSPKGEVPFTASYRAKTNWIENVNPAPGGVPSSGGYTPP